MFQVTQDFEHTFCKIGTKTAGSWKNTKREYLGIYMEELNEQLPTEYVRKTESPKVLESITRAEKRNDTMGAWELETRERRGRDEGEQTEGSDC